MYNKTIISLLLCLTVTFFSCSDNSTEPADSSLPRALEKAEKDVLASSQKFGFKIFKKITETQADSNVFISPLSISTAICMALNGADGQTYNEMYQTLDLNGLSLAEVNSASKSLTDLLTTVDPKVVFNIANSVWYRNDMIFRQEFIQQLVEYYYAQVEGRNFNDPATVDAINGWVENITNGMIDKVIDEIDPAVVMFLINALYFKGTWEKEFNPQNTIDYIFTKIDGSQVNCRMMVQDEKYKYFETEDFQAVDLPYGNGLFSMSVLLPKPGKNLGLLYSQLTDENWNDWMTRFNEQDIRLLMPKFEVEYGIELKDVLMALGMRVPFNGNADFTNIYEPGGIFIGKVLHKTAIKVNEEGTEAAAVTVITFERTSTGDSVPLMSIDRPFLYLIREKSTGTVLFMGQIVNPVM